MASLSHSEDHLVEWLLDNFNHLKEPGFPQHDRDGAQSDIIYRQGNIWTCRLCDAQDIINDHEHGDLVCTNCGTCEKHMSIDGEVCLPFHDLNKARCQSKNILNKNCYKRINYFNDILQRLVGQQSFQVPGECLEAIRGQIQCAKKISPQTVKKAMKNLGLKKWYKHSHLVANTLSGNSALTKISHHEKYAMTGLFKKIQDPFERLKGNRKNFFNYAYIIWQFFHILGIPEKCQTLTMITTRRRLQDQDILWQKICRELDLPFFPTCQGTGN